MLDDPMTQEVIRLSVNLFKSIHDGDTVKLKLYWERLREWKTKYWDTFFQKLDLHKHFETSVLQQLQEFPTKSAKCSYGMTGPAWLIARVPTPTQKSLNTLEHTIYFQECQENAGKNKEDAGISANLQNPYIVTLSRSS